MINKVTETTGQEKIFFVGHSMGATGFMAMAATTPEVGEKIALASLLAPPAYMDHMRSPVKYLAPFVDIIEV